SGESTTRAANRTTGSRGCRRSRRTRSAICSRWSFAPKCSKPPAIARARARRSLSRKKPSTPVALISGTTRRAPCTTLTRRSRSDCSASSSGSLESDATPAHAEDGETVGHRAALARAARDVGMVRNSRRIGRVAVRSEARVARELRLELGGALLDVGLHEELAAPFEQARDVIEQERREHETLLVALLPPRVGEVREEATHARVRHDARERDASVLGEDARALAVAELLQFRVHDRRPFSPDFQAHE